MKNPIFKLNPIDAMIESWWHLRIQDPKKLLKSMLEWFSFECRKTKTKVVTLANHIGHRQYIEPIILCVIILKILIFLRFFPGSLFVKNFQLLLSSFLINLKMAKSFVHRPNFEVPTETKIYHQLINNQTKMTLYLLDT